MTTGEAINQSTAGSSGRAQASRRELAQVREQMPKFLITFGPSFGKGLGGVAALQWPLAASRADMTVVRADARRSTGGAKPVADIVLAEVDFYGPNRPVLRRLDPYEITKASVVFTLPEFDSSSLHNMQVLFPDSHFLLDAASAVVMLGDRYEGSRNGVAPFVKGIPGDSFDRVRTTNENAKREVSSALNTGIFKVDIIQGPKTKELDGGREVEPNVKHLGFVLGGDHELAAEYVELTSGVGRESSRGLERSDMSRGTAEPGDTNQNFDLAG